MEDQEIAVYGTSKQGPSGGEQRPAGGSVDVDVRRQHEQLDDEDYENSPRLGSAENNAQRLHDQAMQLARQQALERAQLKSRERERAVTSYQPRKKADLRSSVQTNTTAYTATKALRMSQGSWRKGKSQKSNRLNDAYSFSGETSRHSSRVKGAGGAVGYFKYSEHNTNRAQSSGRRVGGYSLYQRSMDSMRYRTPRNNMLDERNGPGEHNLQTIVGHKKPVSTMPNSPYFGFAKSDRGLKPCEKNDPYPGTFTYSPEKIKVLNQTPRAKFAKSPRFEESMIFRKNFHQMPHSYIELGKKPVLNKMGIMGKDTRFKQRSQISPGPGQYSPDIVSSLSTVSHKTMNNKLNQTHHGGFFSASKTEDGGSLGKASRKSMPGVNDNEGHLFGTHYNKMHYFPEIDKDFKNREGPGPAKYELFSKVIHSAGVQHSFSKGSRQIELRKKANEPAPNSYKFEKVADRQLSSYQRSMRVAIGKAEKNFDIRNYGALNSSLWSKGLMM